MATNDFLAAGGDNFDMLGGQREEGPSLDTILIDYLNKATAIRTFKAETNIDLAKYQEPFPGERIISIAEAAFTKQEQAELETKEPQVEKETASQLDPTKEKTNRKPTGYLPKTGEFIASYRGISLLIIGGATIGYLWKRKKTA